MKVIGMLWLTICLSLPVWGKERLVVGAKTFTEQYILGSMLSTLLQKSGHTVKEKRNLRTPLLRKALETGDVDIYWEYTGTAYRNFFSGKDKKIATNANLLHETVKRLDQANGIVWLAKASVNNAWVFIAPQSFVEQHRLNTIQDLQGLVTRTEPIVFGLGNDFTKRTDGLKELEKQYGFSVPKNSIQFVPHSSVYGALNRGQVHIGLGYATDPQIKKFRLIALKDNRAFFPKYNPAPVLRLETVQRFPHLVSLVQNLVPHLNNQEMIELNYQVDILEKSVEQVVAAWLQEKGLLP